MAFNLNMTCGQNQGLYVEADLVSDHAEPMKGRVDKCLGSLIQKIYNSTVSQMNKAGWTAVPLVSETLQQAYQITDRSSVEIDNVSIAFTTIVFDLDQERIKSTAEEVKDFYSFVCQSLETRIPRIIELVNAGGTLPA